MIKKFKDKLTEIARYARSLFPKNTPFCMLVYNNEDAKIEFLTNMTQESIKDFLNDCLACINEGQNGDRENVDTETH